MSGEIKTINIHGKQYVEVAERVRLVHDQKRAFELVESEPYTLGDRTLWKVTILVDEKRYKGNAEVKLNAPKNSPDGTNPYECAETSALGRALAFAGFGSVESIASFDEVARAIISQNEQAPQQQRSPRPLPTPVNTPKSRQNGASEPVVVQQGDKPLSVKEYFAVVYKHALALKQFSFSETAGDKEKIQAFLDFAGPVVGATLTSAGHLTKSRLDDIEAYLSAKDAA